MIKWFNRQGIRHAVDQLRADLQSARILAIKQNQSCAVVFNNPEPNTYINSMTRKTVDLGAYHGGVHFMSRGPDNDAMSSRINFTQRGMSVPTADVYLADERLHSIYRIRVLVPGGISIFRWNGSSWQ
jgi:hypothetical protein